MRAPLILVLLLIPAVTALLWARWRADRRAELVSKPIASALFVAAAFVVAPADPHYGAWIRAGLLCSFVGDQLLIGQSRRLLGLGIGAFFCAHGCYLVAVAPLAGPGGGLAPWAVLGAALGLIGVGGLGLRAAWGGLGRLRLPVLAYTAALVGMTAVALAAWFAAPGDPGRALLGVGMALFFVSDLSVLRQRFFVASFSNKLWGLPTYYGGQGLLALSVGSLVLRGGPG